MFKYFACLYKNFGREFPFFKIFSTIAVPLSVCSRSTPRYLMTVFDVITLFPQEIANLECVYSICLIPNRIDSVLPRWRDNLLSISQLLRDNKLSPKTFSIVFMCFPDTNRAESSRRGTPSPRPRCARSPFHLTSHYTRCQINQDRIIFGDFSVNSKLISFKFCKGHFLLKS